MMKGSVVNLMGDKKPKKNSSGNADKFKAKQAKDGASRAPIPPKEIDKKKGK